jgi:hypothetical protein
MEQLVLALMAAGASAEAATNKAMALMNAEVDLMLQTERVPLCSPAVLADMASARVLARIQPADAARLN